MGKVWFQKLLGKFFKGATLIEEAKPQNIDFTAQELLTAFKAAYPSNNRLGKGYKNNVYEALESVSGWINIICEKADLNKDEERFLKAIEEIKSKFDRTDMQGTDKITLPSESIQTLMDGLVGLRGIINRLHYQIIPDTEDKFQNQLAQPPNSMPVLPPIPNEFWYLDNPQDPDKFEARFKSSEPLTTQTSLDRTFTSDVRTKSSRQVFNTLGFLCSDLVQFLVNRGVNFTANQTSKASVGMDQRKG